ncbi:uncharacterized protein LOC135486732 [Lineus longissimus]|uniref:uncharacterized protein LOC135486732 n=1 Tax=Lineus longissimus TaxID=88925 RepID=UPI002B4F073C
MTGSVPTILGPATMWKAECFLILVVAVGLSLQSSEAESTSESVSTSRFCNVCELKKKYFRNTGYSLSSPFPKDNETALLMICSKFVKDKNRYRCDVDCRCRDGQPCLLPCKQIPRLGSCKGRRRCSKFVEQFAAWVSGMCTFTDFPVCAHDLCLCNHNCGLCRALGYQNADCPPLTTTVG